MEVLVIIAILILAVLVILGLLVLLVWAEKSVNADNKRVDDKFREVEHAQYKDTPK